MVAIKKAPRTGRKLHGRKRAAKWQGPRSQRPRIHKEEATDCRRQQELETSRQFQDEMNLEALLEMKGTKGLAKVIGDLITKHAKPRGQQESGEKGYKELFKTLTARRKKSNKGKRSAYHVPRIRPVNPKLYKMGDGVTQSLLHGFLACRVQLQYVLRGWRRAIRKAPLCRR